ncbi:MAG: hypothetical protein M5U28_17240 [Sandaracinaceae bacterium]|nr:hypothetical protein [Sandaracinaceae bacterium]
MGPGGTERWRLPNPGGFRAAASIDREDTLLVSDAGHLLAVGADGTERWRVPVGGARHAGAGARRGRNALPGDGARTSPRVEGTLTFRSDRA